jgi:excisionase family DNA binding protein
MTSLTETDFMTTEDVAAALKVSAMTVRDWRKKNRGPRAYKVGAAVRYDRADVLTWLHQTNGVPA